MSKKKETQETTKVNKIIPIILVVIVLMAIVIIALYLINSKTNNKQTSTNSQNQITNLQKNNFVFDEKKGVKGNISAGGIMEENLLMMLCYLNKKGDSQEITATIKNNSKKVMKFSPENIKITHRNSEANEENTYYTKNLEDLKEYYDWEIVEPKKEKKLKPGEEAKINIKATLKKEVPNNTVVGSFNIKIVE